MYSKCKEAKIILNYENKEIGLQEITFHGHKVTSNGVKAYDGKVKAIVDMPRPTDVSRVQYMAKFIPSFSTTLEPLRKLTRRDTYCKWTEEC